VKLHSAKFEKALKRGVKQAIRRSPELRREARRANPSFRKHYKITIFVRTAFAAALGGAVYGLADSTGHPVTALAVVNLWTFTWIFFRAQLLLMSLFQATDLPVLSLLPTPKTTIFRWELQKFYRAAVMSLLDLIAGFGAVALFVNSTTAPALVLPAAVLGWFVMLALAMLCASRLPRLPYVRISLAFLTLGFVLLVGHSLIGAFAISALERLAPALNVLLPTGWTASLFLLFSGTHEWTLALLLVPIGAVLSTMPGSLARLRAHYQFTEVIHREAPDILPNETDKISVAINDPREKPLRVASESIEEMVRTRLFAVAPEWHERGWIEKTLWRWLSPRERILAEFVFPYGISILPEWKKIFRNVGITFLVALAAGLSRPEWELWILIVGLIITASQVAGNLFAGGAAFRPISSSGVNLPFYAGYGLGFSELSRLLLKHSAVQLPFLIPFSLLCGGFAAYIFKSPVSIGLMLGFKAAGLMLALRFIFLTFAFSSGTNDSTRLRLRTIVLLISILTCGGLFLAFGISAMLVEDAALAWVLWALALVDAYAFWALYGWFYNGKWFDLLSLPKR
jgi:hypothetical protein